MGKKKPVLINHEKVLLYFTSLNNVLVHDKTMCTLKYSTKHTAIPDCPKLPSKVHFFNQSICKGNYSYTHPSTGKNSNAITKYPPHTLQGF